MKVLIPGHYESPRSDLHVEIHKVQYQNGEYAKVKLTLSHKDYGYVYELRKNYKLYFKNIYHWRKVNAIG